MAIPRVSELETEPIVGKFYLVPCVQLRYVGWIPVIGVLHHDKEYIGIEAEHYHRDARFTSDTQNADVTWRICEPSPAEAAMVHILIPRFVDEKPVERRLKCRRRMPDFPLKLRMHAHPLIPQVPHWFGKLEAAYALANAKCGRCPHRGMPLAGLPVKDGAVVCPGHGLKWNVESGELVKRA